MLIIRELLKAIVSEYVTKYYASIETSYLFTKLKHSLFEEKKLDRKSCQYHYRWYNIWKNENLILSNLGESLTKKNNWFK